MKFTENTREMILAEIADKMLPITVYVGAGLLAGVSAALAFTFLRSLARLMAVGSISLLVIIVSYANQVDQNLVEAARMEMGENYLIISRYWAVGSVVAAFILSSLFRLTLRGTISR